MENIEEHCEDNTSDTEATPLIKSAKSPSPLTSTFSSSTPSPPSMSSLSEQSKSQQVSHTGSNNISGSSKDSQNTFAKFNANFGSGRKLNSLDIKTNVASTESSTSSTFSNSSSSNVQTTSVSPRMPHLHKLEKKHSSGDLHSRLKTRKLLGVGETDDGDIHRSKLSQILGHSDQLYIRLPYGLRLWQLLIAVMFTFYGLWSLILPSHILQTTLGASGSDEIVLPIRLYGGALISLSIVYWVTLSTQDRDIIRMCLMTSIVYFAIQFIVSVLSPTDLVAPVYSCLGQYAHIFWRAGQVLGSLYFYVALTRDMRHYR